MQISTSTSFPYFCGINENPVDEHLIQICLSTSFTHLYWLNCNPVGKSLMQISASARLSRLWKTCDANVYISKPLTHLWDQLQPCGINHNPEGEPLMQISILASLPHLCEFNNNFVAKPLQISTLN